MLSLSLSLIAGSAALSAQTQQAPTRDKFVFHLYVDPLHGDDTQATALNPSTGGAMKPLSNHPGSPQFDTNTSTYWWRIAGYLQHAPYSFSTFTGSSGALAWIDANFPTTPKVNEIGWKFSGPGPDRWITDIVVHCLPGLYGPQAQGPIDQRSGMPFNGEAWPAELRSRVSLQGTSFLDTIFDARGQNGNIVHVFDGFLQQDEQETHQNAFIDGIQFRGVRNDDVTRGSGAAILISSYGTDVRQSSSVLISNCVLTDNFIGVAIDSNWDETNVEAVQTPRILNNTFAWNSCGLWIGNSSTVQPTHTNMPGVINNIFDSGIPPGAALTAFSGFEGLEARAMQIRFRGASIGLLESTNAWEVGASLYTYVNRGTPVGSTLSLASNWPVTKASASSPPVFQAPAVDIASYTKGVSGRGALYICDIFRNSPIGGVGGDYSPHDFRLSPSVSQSPGALPTIDNPLVDAGIDDEGGGEAPLVTWHGNVFDRNPAGGSPSGLGLPPEREEADLMAWDFDGEGFGNPRIVSVTGTNDFGDIDIGADEAGELIIGGFINGTRILSHGDIPGTTGIASHTKIYFFQKVGPLSYPRPQANLYSGGEVPNPGGNLYLPWWSHVQAGIDADIGNYTVGAYVSNPVVIDRTNLYLSVGLPWMRSLACDFSAHCLPDIHPLWPWFLDDASLPSPAGPYASNPWFAYPNTPPSALVIADTADNPTLYHNRGGQNHGRPGLGTFGFTQTSLMNGHINPPGTYLTPGRFTLPPTLQLGPFGSCSGSSSYQVGSWGYGATGGGCPDEAPGDPNKLGVGIRVNAEVLSGAGVTLSNLQTFLAIRDSDILPPLPAGARALPARKWMMDAVRGSERVRYRLERQKR